MHLTRNLPRARVPSSHTFFRGRREIVRLSPASIVVALRRASRARSVSRVGVSRRSIHHPLRHQDLHPSTHRKLRPTLPFLHRRSPSTLGIKRNRPRRVPRARVPKPSRDVPRSMHPSRVPSLVFTVSHERIDASRHTVTPLRPSLPRQSRPSLARRRESRRTGTSRRLSRASSNVNTPTHTRAPTASRRRDDDAFDDDAFDDVEASARDDGSMRARATDARRRATGGTMTCLNPSLNPSLNWDTVFISFT